MTSSLTLLAGPDALRWIRGRGLRAEDVDVVPGASGGPKWLVLAGLDRWLFGAFLQAPRERALHLIGSSLRPRRLGRPGPGEPRPPRVGDPDAPAEPPSPGEAPP